MQTFNIDVYDSRNTCSQSRIEARNGKSAINKIKALSKIKEFPIVLYVGNNWVKFLRGEVREWVS